MALILDTHIKPFCLEHSFDRTYWIAYSGGLDSHVLLHLFANMQSVHPVKLKAIHINHGLSPHAEKWVEHCAQICRELEVEFLHQSIQAKSTPGESPENIARQRRYEVLEKILQPNDFLLTAHHQDDQAETVLLQMFRGAGPKGLASMPRIKTLGKGFHARPLLDIPREDLKNYAEKNSLQWIDDESNAHIHFSRNFIRHQILPVLKTRWQSVSETLSRVALHCAEAQDCIEQTAATDLAAVQGITPDTLSIKKLLLLELPRQKQVLRAWFTQFNFPVPSTLKLQQILQDMLQAREDKLPHIAWNGVELRRYRDHLYVMSCLKEKKPETVEWDFLQPLVFSDGSQLFAEKKNDQGLKMHFKKVTVTFRQGGEKIILPGRTHHHSLKNFFQEQGVPPWERDRVPLIYVNDELAAVVGFFVSDRFVAKENEEGWDIKYKS